MGFFSNTGADVRTFEHFDEFIHVSRTIPIDTIISIPNIGKYKRYPCSSDERVLIKVRETNREKIPYPCDKCFFNPMPGLICNEISCVCRQDGKELLYEKI